MSWGKHETAVLRDYLVGGVQDPRINVQSILTRHFLIEQLFGERFAVLMEQELRFALVINWLLRLLKGKVSSWQPAAVLDALLDGKDNADELEIPRFVSETFAGLALPNYICDVLIWAPVEKTRGPVPEYPIATFQRIWGEVLESEEDGRISVLEPACGSANDYRFIEEFGIAKFLDYTGFDLCEKNIRNAREMLPEVSFEVGNVLEIDAPDKTFDCCFVHDLFEHLSVDAMKVAIAELFRVTREAICMDFFNMYEGDRHIVKPVDSYHWNKLSRPAVQAIFEQYTSRVQVIHIEEFLASQFGCGEGHNRGAYTFIIEM